MRPWLLAALLLAACAHERPCGPEPRTLYVVSHGWHSGIVVERAELAKRLPLLDSAHRYLEIGWGEERFYQARETTVGMALRAVLWPNASVVQVVRFDEPPHRYFAASEVREFRTDVQGFEAALERIAATFLADLTPLAPSLYGDGSFYRAKGAFHLFNNCNRWVERVLDAARCGLPGER